MPIDKAKHLPLKLVSALSKAKAKAKQKMAHASSSSQPDHSDVSDDSSSTAEPSEYGVDVASTHKTSSENKDDREQMLKRDFKAFSAEEYQVEIGPLVEELRRWMNIQDALESLG